MEQRISLVTLGVADLEASRSFYERLGWRRSVEKAEGVAFYQAGIVLALYPRQSLSEDLGMALSGAANAPLTLALNVRSRIEVDRVLEEAVAAGARLLKRATDAPWGGYVGYFADPDGFAWEVAWNPHFPLDAQGRIQLPE
jgi:uncharacterized protein